MFLATHPKGPKLPPSAIAATVHCQVNTVKKWLEVYRTTGDVEEKPRSGRKRVTTEKEDKQIGKNGRERWRAYQRIYC